MDEKTLEELVVPLTELIRRGLGLGTKCGTAQFLVSLSAHTGALIAPHTGKLLAALLHGVLDKNKLVQRDMARAIGSLVVYAKVSTTATHIISVFLNKVISRSLPKLDIRSGHLVANKFSYPILATTSSQRNVSN